jgi:hypothetical protein
VAGDAESPTLAEPLDQSGEHGIVEEAAVQVLDAPAALAEEVMVVSGEGLGQLEARPPVRGVRPTEEPDVLEESQRAVDGGAVGPSGSHPPLDVGDGAGRPVGRQSLQDGPAGPGEAVPVSREDGGDRHEGVSRRHRASGIARCDPVAI